MTDINWDAMGVVISAIGLLLVIRSLRQVKHSLDMTTVGNLYGSLHNVHSTFIEYPKLRPYFYNNVPLAREDVEEEAHLRAQAIAEMYLDTFEHIYAMQPWAPKHLQLLLVEYIRHMCSRSPFLRTYLLENEDLLHPPELLSLVQREEARSSKRTAHEAHNPVAAQDG